MDEHNWPFFRIKLETYVAQKIGTEIGAYNLDIPKDTDDLSNDAAKVKVRMQNAKAFSVLLNSIDTSTERGKFVFRKVSKFIKQTDGYAAGNYKDALASLVYFFEKKDEVQTVNFKQQYFSTKMEEDEYPLLQRSFRECAN